MRPEQWVIDDMRAIRKKLDKTHIELQYLELLIWYVSVLNEKERK